jgi:hypothetical protein
MFDTSGRKKATPFCVESVAFFFIDAERDKYTILSGT